MHNGIQKWDFCISLGYRFAAHIKNYELRKPIFEFHCIKLMAKVRGLSLDRIKMLNLAIGRGRAFKHY